MSTGSHLSNPEGAPLKPSVGLSGSLHTPREVADRRAQSPHTSMFFRMLVRAAALRRRRAASALLAMIVAAAVATAMMNLYVDVQAKLRSEFRNYGANVIIVAKNSGKDGQSLPADALSKVESVLGPKTLTVPFAYAVARTKEGQSVVVVGTDFARARQLNQWWKVSHWPDAPTDALVGMRAADVVSPSGSPNRQPFELTFQGKAVQLTPAGMLQTGSRRRQPHLSRSIRIPELDRHRTLDHRSGRYRNSFGSGSVDSSTRRDTPRSRYPPVRQIMEGEANVLNKTRATLYASATLVILTSALCVSPRSSDGSSTAVATSPS